MTSRDKVSLHLICVCHLAHLLDRGNVQTGTFQFSSVRGTAAVWFVKWKESSLTNKLTDLTGWILCSCPYTYREVIQESAPWTSSPTLPWGHVRFTVIHDRLLSGIWSGILQSHLEYWLCHFFLSQLREQQEAIVGISWVTQRETFRCIQYSTIQYNTHAHTCTWHLMLGSLSSYALPYQKM